MCLVRQWTKLSECGRSVNYRPVRSTQVPPQRRHLWFHACATCARCSVKTFTGLQTTTRGLSAATAYGLHWQMQLVGTVKELVLMQRQNKTFTLPTIGYLLFRCICWYMFHRLPVHTWKLMCGCVTTSPIPSVWYYSMALPRQVFPAFQFMHSRR